jgi:hypothetical protein
MKGRQIRLASELGRSFGEEWSSEFIDLFQAKDKSGHWVAQFFYHADTNKCWDSQDLLQELRTKIIDPFIANAIYGRDVHKPFTIDEENYDASTSTSSAHYQGP